MTDTDNWQFSLRTEVGWLVVAGNRQALTSAAFSFSAPAADHGENALSRRARGQLQAYLKDPQRGFDLPIEAKGTLFQQRVWRCLQTIPAGQTWSYGQLARHIDSSARAVGGACRRNPVALIVPCHRVVAANGPGGYAGDTNGRNMQVKQWLLAHEAS